MYDTKLITLRDFWDHTAKEIVMKNHSENHQKMIETLAADILEAFGNMRMADITTSMLDQYFYNIRHETTGRRQMKKGLLNRIFNEALQRRIIAKNPVLKTRIIRTPYNPVYGLSDDSMQALINYDDDSVFCDLLKTQLFSGLSISELLGLAVPDVHADSEAIDIQRFVKNTADNRSIVSASLRSKKPRTILIPKHAMYYIQKAVNRRSDADSPLPADDAKSPEYIFTRDDKSPISNFAVRNYYRKVGRATGIEFLSPHLLETNFGLRAAGLKINPKDLKIYLGYKTCFTAAKYYDFADNDSLPATKATEQYYNKIMEEEKWNAKLSP